MFKEFVEPTLPSLSFSHLFAPKNGWNLGRWKRWLLVLLVFHRGGIHHLFSHLASSILVVSPIFCGIFYGLQSPRIPRDHNKCYIPWVHRFGVHPSVAALIVDLRWKPGRICWHSNPLIYETPRLNRTTTAQRARSKGRWVNGETQLFPW